MGRADRQFQRRLQSDTGMALKAQVVEMRQVLAGAGAEIQRLTGTCMRLEKQLQYFVRVLCDVGLAHGKLDENGRIEFNCPSVVGDANPHHVSAKYRKDEPVLDVMVEPMEITPEMAQQMAGNQQPPAPGPADQPQPLPIDKSQLLTVVSAMGEHGENVR